MKLNRSYYIRSIVSFGLFVLMASTYQNCSKVYFSKPEASPAIFGGPTGGTEITISKFKPALAVRDLTCLACHANIQSSVITDFGASNSWYMGGFSDPQDFGSVHYMPTTLGSLAQVNGQLIVPEATVLASFVNAELQSGATPATGPVSLASYLMRTDLYNFVLKDFNYYAYFNQPIPATNSLTNNVVPQSSGSAPVVTSSNIYIGAPTTQEILNIVPAPSSGAWIQVKGAASPGVSGLSVTTGNNGKPYIVNVGNVDCSGKDVVINGTLILSNLNVHADNGGCRLYVTGPVFIVGPITYLNSGGAADPTRNLQITSSNSIIMGVGLNGVTADMYNNPLKPELNYTPLEMRLIGGARTNMVIRSANTPTQFTDFANAIVDEGKNIGLPLLQDASVIGSTASAHAACGQMRAAIDFQRLLLNAPIIHSRYLGTVTGLIIAESAVFSLGEFSFNYDPVFQTVRVLPALPFDLMCTDANCHPADP